jgi:hypothetical protein
VPPTGEHLVCISKLHFGAGKGILFTIMENITKRIRLNSSEKRLAHLFQENKKEMPI